MKIFVLTGSIGSGKSLIASLVCKQRVAIIDADIVVRELQRPGEKVYNEIVKVFGSECVLEDGSLNRKAIADVVFANEEKRKILNHLTHPTTIKTMIIECLRISCGLKQKYGLPGDCSRVVSPLAIALVIPLYFEANVNFQLPVVNIGVSDIEMQKRRILVRDNEAAIARLSKQMSLEEREKRATLSLRNDGDPQLCADELARWIATDGAVAPFGVGLILQKASAILLVLLFFIVLLLAWASKMLHK